MQKIHAGAVDGRIITNIFFKSRACVKTVYKLPPVKGKSTACFLPFHYIYRPKNI
jgi:hypothetical protein